MSYGGPFHFAFLVLAFASTFARWLRDWRSSLFVLAVVTAIVIAIFY